MPSINAIFERQIIDSRGQVRGTIAETAGGEIHVRLTDKYGRNRLNCSTAENDLVTTLFDDFLRLRMLLKIENGRPLVVVFDPQTEKPIYSLLASQAQGDVQLQPISER